MTNDLPSKITSYFDVERAGDVSWAHGANTRARLAQYSSGASKVMILEGDVLFLPETGEAVMAHDYKQSVELVFAEWVGVILEACRGAKLDFKKARSGASELPAVRRCLKMLERVWDSEVPLVLNADIFVGPGGDESYCLDPRKFMQLCCEYRRRHNPNILLSLGWTTGYVKGGKYTGEMIDQALAIAKGPTTFPVRACYIKDSWEQIQRLLEDSQHTLTVWNGEVVSDDLKEWLRSETAPERTFYDIYDPSDRSPIRLWEG